MWRRIKLIESCASQGTKIYPCQLFSSKLLPSFRGMYMVKAGVHLSKLPTVNDIFSITFHLTFSKYFD